MKNAADHGLAAFALLACAGPGLTRSPAAKAEAVIAASKRATGGSAWDKLEGCYETGTHAGGAIKYKTWFDLRRYGIRVESERGGSTRAMGFNGTASWKSNSTGGVDVATGGNPLKEAIVTAYLSNNAFYFPNRFPADLHYMHKAKERSRVFDVLKVTPEGGRPIELWFDSRSHLLRRVVDNHGTPPVRVEATDYRRAGKISAAFKLTVTDREGQVVDQGALTSLSCGPIDTRLFDPPKNP